MPTTMDQLRQCDPIVKAGNTLLRSGETEVAAALFAWADLVLGQAELASPIAESGAEFWCYTYAVPNAPTTGTVVQVLADGSRWEVIPDPFFLEPQAAVPMVCRMVYQGGLSDTDAAPFLKGELVGWTALLVNRGRVAVCPPDPNETALYGPPGQRWGNPHQPCIFVGCVLGRGHNTRHIDQSGQPITEPADEPNIQPDLRPCTCGNLSHHELRCPRNPQHTYYKENHRHEPAICAEIGCTIWESTIPDNPPAGTFDEEPPW